jgi:hypothetical protein
MAHSTDNTYIIFIRSEPTRAHEFERALRILVPIPQVEDQKAFFVTLNQNKYNMAYLLC